MNKPSISVSHNQDRPGMHPPKHRLAWWIIDVLIVPAFRVLVRVVDSKPASRTRRIWRHVNWSARLSSLGADSIIHSHVIVYSPQKVAIGSRSTVAEFVHIWGNGGVTIGNEVMIASHAVITSQTHDPDAGKSRYTSIESPVVIEDNVWIGAGVIILPGIRVGSGAVIGAGSVVTKDVPSGWIVKGIPAKQSRLVGVERET